MFLDDELEQIYKEKGVTTESSKELLQTCLKRLPNTEKCSNMTFLNTLRQIEASWKLFCSRHKEYNPNGIRDFIMGRMQLSKNILEVLHW